MRITINDKRELENILPSCAEKQPNEVEIKSYDFDVEKSDIKDARKRIKYGVMRYYVTTDGVMKERTEAELKQQPEFEAYQQRMRQAEYQTKTDGLFFKEQRGEVPAGTWAKAVEAVKATVY